MLSLHAEWGDNLYLSYWKALKLDLYRSGVTLNLDEMGMLPEIKTLRRLTSPLTQIWKSTSWTCKALLLHSKLYEQTPECVCIGHLQGAMCL